MGNIRAQQVSKSKSANDQAEQNKLDADVAAGWAQGKLAVIANADAIQTLVESNQRLEAKVEELSRGARGTDSGGAAPP